MAFDYVESARDALALLQDFEAKPITVTVRAPAPDDDDYNPSTGTGVELVPATVTALGVLLDFPLIRKSSGNQPDALIRAGARYVILAALDVNGVTVMPEQLPIEAEVLGPDGLVYVIKDANPLNPTGVPVLYELNVRR